MVRGKYETTQSYYYFIVSVFSIQQEALVKEEVADARFLWRYQTFK